MNNTTNSKSNPKTNVWSGNYRIIGNIAIAEMPPPQPLVARTSASVVTASSSSGAASCSVATETSAVAKSHDSIANSESSDDVNIITRRRSSMDEKHKAAEEWQLQAEMEHQLSIMLFNIELAKVPPHVPVPVAEFTFISNDRDSNRNKDRRHMSKNINNNNNNARNDYCKSDIKTCNKEDDNSSVVVGSATANDGDSDEDVLEVALDIIETDVCDLSGCSGETLETCITEQSSMDNSGNSIDNNEGNIIAIC